MFDVRYFVNEEKKIVVCKLENCFKALNCDMCHKGWPGSEALMIDNEFVGKAQCSPEDTFDIEIGKKIAYKRAVIKMIKAKKRTLDNFVKDYQRVTNDLVRDTDKMIRKYESSIDRKDQDILRILREENN